MGCADCKNAQISKEQEYYIRVGSANILVFGCREHIGRMFEELKIGVNIIEARKHINPDERSLKPGWRKK